MIDVEISPMRADERSFVLKSWKISLRFGTLFCHERDPDKAFARINPHVDKLMSSGGVSVLVARMPEVEADAHRRPTIYGFVATEGDVLHYAYTRSFFRRHGVFTALYAELEVEPARYATESRFDSLWERLGMEFVGVRGRL